MQKMRQTSSRPFFVFFKKTLWTQSKMYVMLTFEKPQKYYFLNRVKYIEGSLMKSSGKICREY